MTPSQPKTDATPTPWVAKRLAMSERYALLWPSKSGRRMTRVDEWGAFTKDDADLIVRAVNSHDALLAAAQCAQNVLFLLADEAKALGLRAENVQQMLADAIAASIPKEPT